MDSSFTSQSGYYSAYSAMRLDLWLNPTRWGLHSAGTLEWDSATGHLGGSLGALVRKTAEEVVGDGFVRVGPPPGGYEYPVAIPLCDPAHVAALLAYLDYELPRELAPYFRTDMPDAFDDLSPTSRSNAVQ